MSLSTRPIYLPVADCCQARFWSGNNDFTLFNTDKTAGGRRFVLLECFLHAFDKFYFFIGNLLDKLSTDIYLNKFSWRGLISSDALLCEMDESVYLDTFGADNQQFTGNCRLIR